MIDIELTLEEKKAIAALKRVAKIWPKSLWLYSASATLWVMRQAEDGRRGITITGGVDPDHIIESINIPNDGGDW